MKKVILKKNPKADHKSDEAVLVGASEVKKVKKDNQDERIKKQFAEDALIHQRIKCPVAAMVCCLMHRV